MTLATAFGATPWGIDAKLVTIEIDVRLGMPQTHLVGLGDAAVRESKERVRCAIRNSEIDLEHRAVEIAGELRERVDDLGLGRTIAAHGRPDEAVAQRGHESGAYFRMAVEKPFQGVA